MRYQLAPISTRPWLLNGLSLRLIESRYENHYGARLPAREWHYDSRSSLVGRLQTGTRASTRFRILGIFQNGGTEDGAPAH